MVKDRNSNNKSDDGLEKSKEINGDILLNNVNNVEEEKTVIKEEENPDRKRIVASKLLYPFYKQIRDTVLSIYVGMFSEKLLNMKKKNYVHKFNCCSLFVFFLYQSVKIELHCYAQIILFLHVHNLTILMKFTSAPFINNT